MGRENTSLVLCGVFVGVCATLLRVRGLEGWWAHFRIWCGGVGKSGAYEYHTVERHFMIGMLGLE
jgi:hypothetical protein